MIDINLLKDTTGHETDKKPEPATPSVQYSVPERERLDEKKAKPPSGFSLWLKNLFRRKAAAPPPVKPERLANVKAMKPAAIPEPNVIAGPPDMFAELDQPPPRRQPPDRPKPVRPPQADARAPMPPPPAPEPARLSVRPPNLMELGSRTDSPSQPKPAALSRGGGMSAPAPTSNSQFLVNLLPEEYTVGPREIKHKLVSLGLVAVLSVVAVVAAYFLLTLYESNYAQKSAKLDDELVNVQAQITGLEPVRREAVSFRDKVLLLQGLMATHIHWTNFFEKLEKYTVAGIDYSDIFNGSTNGDVSFDGTANTLEDVAHQLAVFEQSAGDFVLNPQLVTVGKSSVKTTSGGEIELGGYHFTIGARLHPLLFFDVLGSAASAAGVQTDETGPSL